MAALELFLNGENSEEKPQSVAVIISNAEIVEWDGDLVPCCAIDRAGVGRLIEQLQQYHALMS